MEELKKIDKVKKVKGGYDIYIGDDKYLIHKEVYLNGDIYEESNINLHKLLYTSNYYFALEKATIYSSRALKTSGQIKKYLDERNYSVYSNEIIEKLISYGYIDDQRYANNYIDSRKDKNGKYYILNKLRERGISKSIIDNITIEEDPITAYNIIKNKYKFDKIRDKEYSKITNFLISRGFSYDTIRKSISIYKERIVSLSK